MRSFQILSLLALVSSISFLGCKDKEVLDPHVLTQDYYYQFILDGDTTTYQETVNDYGNLVGDFFGGEVANGWEYAPYTCLASPEAVANPTPSTLQNSGAVAIISMPGGQITTSAGYQSLVTTGSLPYGLLSREPADSARAGAFVSVIDDAGVEWNTNNGVQDGSESFIVSEYIVQADRTRTPKTERVIAINFACKVYNANGDSKVLTGGQVRGRYIIFI
jgi:hypothetical protein